MKAKLNDTTEHVKANAMLRDEDAHLWRVDVCSRWNAANSGMLGCVVILNSDRPCMLPKLACTDQNRLIICGWIRGKKLDSETLAKEKKRNDKTNRSRHQVY